MGGGGGAYLRGGLIYLLLKLYAKFSTNLRGGGGGLNKYVYLKRGLIIMIINPFKRVAHLKVQEKLIRIDQCCTAHIVHSCQ